MDVLARFHGDKNAKEAVLQFLKDFVGEYAKEKVLKREDVSGIADASDIISKAFEQLDILYAIPKREGEQTNHSR